MELQVNFSRKVEERFERLIQVLEDSKGKSDRKKIVKVFSLLFGHSGDRVSGINEKHILSIVDSAIIAVKEIGLGEISVIAVFLSEAVISNNTDLVAIEKKYGKDIRIITEGLTKIEHFGSTTTSSQADNYRKLLINLASDVRVILIKLARQLELMRRMKELPDDVQLQTAFEASYLYAPLAHRLGLYNIKSEMEDLALKYTDRKTYDTIARKLAETMRARNTFIKDFVSPIEKLLKESGFSFEIKGRPKSIHSIWNKMINKGVEFEDIYDLFAIRIIIDSGTGKEKSDCWQVYSAVTDIYQPNPLRLRDWISVPKTNGYESLHTTVVGPGGKWVEVQIRTRRMNEIAEKGFAAHWKYKGLKDEQGLDEWLIKMREILETPEPGTAEFVDDFKLSLYSKEIFVFTPAGDLKKFPKGATVLDFAYDIHSDLGATCSGAKINGKVVPIRHLMKNGDRVEILGSKNQSPKLDWLNFVVTSKAKSKIRQRLNEEKAKSAEHGKELLKRRLKNWKITYDDDIVRRLLRKYKLKTSQDLYYLLSVEKIDLVQVKEFLTEETEEENEQATLQRDIEGTVFPETAMQGKGDDFLIIDEKVSNVDYKLAKCCSPVYGDPVFGFVTVSSGIKIHRMNCPNAAQMFSRYNYRIVKAKWARTDKESSFPTEIRISGEETTGILNDISDVIATDTRVHLRGIKLDSEKGMFTGKIKLTVKDIQHLDSIIARLNLIRGIYKVNRTHG